MYLYLIAIVDTLIFGVSGGSQIYVVLAQSLDSPIGYPLNPKYSEVVDGKLCSLS